MSHTYIVYIKALDNRIVILSYSTVIIYFIGVLKYCNTHRFILNTYVQVLMKKEYVVLSKPHILPMMCKGRLRRVELQ